MKKPSFTLNAIFESAEDFYFTAEHLMEEVTQQIVTSNKVEPSYYSKPAIVNMSVAIEIYFKSLYFLESRKYFTKSAIVLQGKNQQNNGHSFSQLFSAVSRESQYTIRQYFEAHSNCDKSFEFLLEWYSHTFEEWRYSYENHPHNFVEYAKLKILADAVRTENLAKMAKGEASQELEELV